MADDDSERPITIIIGPTTIGGNNLFNHFVPNNLIKPATITYIKPTATKPVKAGP